MATPSRVTLECGERSTPGLDVELVHVYTDDYALQAEVHFTWTTDGLEIRVERVQDDPEIRLVLA